MHLSGKFFNNKIKIIVVIKKKVNFSTNFASKYELVNKKKT